MQNVQFDAETTEKTYLCHINRDWDFKSQFRGVHMALGAVESDVRLSASIDCRLEWKIWRESLFVSWLHDVISSRSPNCNFEAEKKVINLVNGRFLIATLQSPPRPLQNRSFRLDRRHKSFEPSRFDKKRKCVTRYQARFHNFFACLAPQRKFSARQKWKP